MDGVDFGVESGIVLREGFDGLFQLADGDLTCVVLRHGGERRGRSDQLIRFYAIEGDKRERMREISFLMFIYFISYYIYTFEANRILTELHLQPTNRMLLRILESSTSIRD